MKSMKLAASAGALAATLTLGFAIGAMAAQPHMENALSYLRNARSELVTATANKGGHRATAIRLVNQAINETEAGMDFDRRH
jgi:hypothetical protein